MKLLKVSVPTEKLARMPEDEQLFFLTLGAMLNDLSMFQKLMLFSSNVETSDTVVRSAQNLQSLNLARFRVCVLWEGWLLLQRHFFGSGVSKKYEPQLGQAARQSLDQLKQYFGSGQGKWMGSVRNQFGYHYPSSMDLAEVLKDLQGSDELELYVSEFFGNCIFRTSSTLLYHGVLKATGEATLDQAMDKWLNDTNRVSRWFGDFLGECLLIVAKTYLGLESDEVEIPQPPRLDEVVLPYFIDVPAGGTE
jgi:hypothetical protein